MTSHIRSAVLAVFLVVAATSVAFSAAPLVNTAAVTVPTCTKPTSNVTAQKEVDYAQCLQNRTEALLTNLHPAPTVTETVTVTASPTSSPSTATSSPSPSPTSTAAPAPAAPASTCTKPDATNTGTTGTLTSYAGATYVSDPGTVIDSKTISGDLTIAAANVTLKNSKVTGHVLVATTTGTKILNSTMKGVAVSSSQTVTIDHNDIGYAADDAIHVTSDNGSMVKDVKITNNYVHDPAPPPGSHWDGLQVRGSQSLTVSCNNFQLGAPDQSTYNASVYLEGGANGGNSGTVVDGNWLFGGAFGLMYGADNDNATRITGNHFGGTYVWQTQTTPGDGDAACYTGGGPAPAAQTGNDLRGTPFTPCP